MEPSAFSEKGQVNFPELQTTSFLCLFQLDDSKSLHKKWLFRQTSTKKNGCLGYQVSIKGIPLVWMMKLPILNHPFRQHKKTPTEVLGISLPPGYVLTDFPLRFGFQKAGRKAGPSGEIEGAIHRIVKIG